MGTTISILNPGRERWRLQLWRKANPDKARAQYRRSHTNNKEKRNDYNRSHWRLYYSPERWHIYCQNRRARKRNADGRFTVREWQALKAAYNYTCLCCLRREPEIKLTADHVIPLVAGGSNNIDNIQPLCMACNNQKRANTVDYRNGRQPLLLALEEQP